MVGELEEKLPVYVPERDSKICCRGKNQQAEDRHILPVAIAGQVIPTYLPF